jgi:K+ transporter
MVTIMRVIALSVSLITWTLLWLVVVEYIITLGQRVRSGERSLERIMAPSPQLQRVLMCVFILTMFSLPLEGKMEREDIVSLYSRIEQMKETDPRCKGSIEDVVSFYMDVDTTIKNAGWNVWEYQTTLFAAMGG